jgi:hypothetical protein
MCSIYVILLSMKPPQNSFRFATPCLPLPQEVYSHRKTESKQNGDFTVSRWECRLLKKRQSSTAKTTKRTGSEEIQRRNTSIRQKDLCKVRITVTRTVATSLVSVKRIGEDCHSHTIEDSFIAKRPKFLLDTPSRAGFAQIFPHVVFHLWLTLAVFFFLVLTLACVCDVCDVCGAVAQIFPKWSFVWG